LSKPHASDGQERLIGWCALAFISRKHHEAELGYALKRRYWGQGYTPEAARALLTFGFTTLTLQRVFATCHPGNQASEHVLQKLSMRKEGYLREHRWSKGAWRDSLLYALLAQELSISLPLEKPLIAQSVGLVGKDSHIESD
jgi:ribosomal-protein-alanine N-acetyltransferase